MTSLVENRNLGEVNFDASPNLATGSALRNLAFTEIGQSPIVQRTWKSGTAVLRSTEGCLPGAEALHGEHVAFE
jgi:hypothetical protein